MLVSLWLTLTLEKIDWILFWNLIVAPCPAVTRPPERAGAGTVIVTSKDNEVVSGFT